MENILFLVLALFLVALNGLFVAAEFSIVTLRKTRVNAIARTTGLRGRILEKVHGKLDAYLSACQLGITLASLGLGWDASSASRWHRWAWAGSASRPLPACSNRCSRSSA